MFCPTQYKLLRDPWSGACGTVHLLYKGPFRNEDSIFHQLAKSDLSYVVHSRSLLHFLIDPQQAIYFIKLYNYNE